MFFFIYLNINIYYNPIFALFNKLDILLLNLLGLNLKF